MKTKPTIKITTRPVGVNFGCAAIVRRASNGRKIHETRVYPHGCESNAYSGARNWAEENGYVLVEDTGD